MRFLSQVYTIARGSVGGITYTANQWYQLIARARTAPVQPNTPFQTGIRSAFDVADSFWVNLSPAVKLDWEAYAATCVYSGPLGNYTIPGRQMFIGLTSLVKYSQGVAPGLGIVYDNLAPVIAGFFNPGSVTVGTYAGLSAGIAVDVAIDAGDPAIGVVDVSIAFNDSRLRYKGPWLSASKALQELPASAAHTISVDRPLPAIGRICFSRTRIFTANVSPAGALPHRLAALFYLRHTILAAP